MDDASSQTDQPRPQIMDPLFNPAPSQRTKNTRNSNKSNKSGQRPSTAYDIEHFFILSTIENDENGKVKKRVCKVCGYVFRLSPADKHLIAL